MSRRKTSRRKTSRRKTRRRKTSRRKTRRRKKSRRKKSRRKTRPYCTSILELKKTSSVYDCTVEDVEYIYNKLSIRVFNSKRRRFHSNA